MDATIPKGERSADRHSHLVRPQDMDWQKTRFAGCEAKTLLFDRRTGLMTALMRFAPGSVLPDHEHVGIEQSWVIEGALVDKEGPAKDIACKAGEFIWREAGSRHAAWCPDGALILAMFQVPNKFFEADGRVVDAAGQDWDETWGHTAAQRARSI
ncbi:cupin domain-containing protein [Bradyrhizobium liaoningense]